VKKIGFYPGSFNPWHSGHEDVLRKALLVFDQVVIGVGVNSDKGINESIYPLPIADLVEKYGNRVTFTTYTGLMVNCPTLTDKDVVAVIRGLRNGYDLQYEMNQQYWNEDLGLKIPVIFFITDRTLAHVSSSAIRSIHKVKE